MGKGKGAFLCWVTKAKKGQILYEISGISLEIAKKVFKAGSNKLPVKTKFITLDPLDVTSERLRSLHNVILGVVAVEMFLHQPSSDADQRAEAKSRIRRRETAGPSERHQILAW